VRLKAIRLYLISFLFFITAAVSGCVTMSGAGPQVIEKSKETRPAWVLDDGRGSRDEGGKLLFIKEQSHLKDLPLGVKDTQFQALIDSREFLRNKIVDHITTVSADSGISLTNKKQMTTAVAKAVRSSHNSFARIQDIYYEKIVDQSVEDKLEREYYTVFVKVEYPKAQINMILRKLSSKFSRSKFPDLGEIAVRLSKLEWKLYSH